MATPIDTFLIIRVSEIVTVSKNSLPVQGVNLVKWHKRERALVVKCEAITAEILRGAS